MRTTGEVEGERGAYGEELGDRDGDDDSEDADPSGPT
jgi:hypothetical protein